MTVMSRVDVESGGLAKYILKNPAVVIAWIISLISGVGLFVVWVLMRAIGTDFGVYWRTANGAVADVYSTAFEYPFPYAPTMLLWISPLSVMPMWPAYLAFIILSVTAMYRVCRQHLPRNVALLVIASPSLTNGLMTGQVSAALAAAVLWAVAHKDRLTAGIIIGLVATVKPQLVALAPLYFIIQSDWRAFFGAAMSFVAVLCSTLMLFGPAIWMDWAASLPHFREVLNDKFITGAMVTPAGFAEWHQLPTWPFLVIGGLIGVLLVFVCRNSEPVKATAAVTAGSLLASPYALTYDLAAIMPFMAYLVYRGSIPAAVAISAALNPMPLLVAAYCLAKGPK